MRHITSFGFATAAAAVAVRKAARSSEPDRPAAQGDHDDQRYIEVSADRLGEISTDKLSELAESFHVLTVEMYSELSIRRAVELGTTQIEDMLRQGSGS